MKRIARFLQSPIGRKVMMALTGLFLAAFLIGHMAGNLLGFKSSADYNEYGHGITSSVLLYVIEIGLLTLFAYHTINGILLVIRNRKARGGQNYKVSRSAKGKSRQSLASKTMIFTGIGLLLFVPFHIWSMKFGTCYVEAGTGYRDLWALMLTRFTDPMYVGIYTVAMGIVGLHLWHGIGSAFNTMGARKRDGLRKALQGLAVVIAVGFISVPLYIFMTQDPPKGLVECPAEGPPAMNAKPGTAPKAEAAPSTPKPEAAHRSRAEAH